MAEVNNPKDQEARGERLEGARNLEGKESEQSKARRAKKTPEHQTAEEAAKYLKKYRRP